MEVVHNRHSVAKAIIISSLLEICDGYIYESIGRVTSKTKKQHKTLARLQAVVYFIEFYWFQDDLWGNKDRINWKKSNYLNIYILLILSIATSIDAFAVGIILIITGIKILVEHIT